MNKKEYNKLLAIIKRSNLDPKKKAKCVAELKREFIGLKKK